MFNWDSNKNCPFCDGEPVLFQAIENDPTSLVATCPDDDCVGSTIRCSIDLWNTRAAHTIEPIEGLEEALNGNGKVRYLSHRNAVEMSDAVWDKVCEAAVAYLTLTKRGG